MTAVHYQIFDDLLIGNFMKVTLHGDWGPGRLYPDFRSAKQAYWSARTRFF